MRIAVALLSYNRLPLLQRTLNSLYTSEVIVCNVPICAVDNGSNDGSEGLIARIGGYCNRDGNRTVGHGMNLAIERALLTEPDIVLFTADDYEYRADWLQRLLAFWEEAPEDVKIATCNLEPDYDWNTVREVIEAGGEKSLIRDSVPGANWSFRAEDWPLIGPMAETTGGEDLAVCRRLREQGYRLATLDLTEHIGERKSAWGNRSWTVARPLDKAKWGL